MNEQQQFDFLDMLAIIGFTVQMANYQQNARQSTNDDLMKEMRAQDKVYLEKIVEQNNEIIRLLKERDV